MSVRRRLAQTVWANLTLPALGLLGLVLLWWLGTRGSGNPMAARFAPSGVVQALQHLLAGDIWPHVLASMRRVLIGLGGALLAGIPLGLLVGCCRWFERSSTVSMQFLRMISPLSWMPIAVMALGVGDAPVYFLLGFAAVWPILINVAAGVHAIDPRWRRLARSLGATGAETLRHVVVPAMLSHLLTGVRIAIGLIWVVLVPAEMLGVQSGLGYFILDTRDRMAYGELLAVVLLIGACGFVLDWLVRQLQAQLL